MGLIKIIKEERRKLEEMGARAYTENIITNEEVYGPIPEKDKENLLIIGKGASKLEGKETTELSILEVIRQGSANGVVYALGAGLRVKQGKDNKTNKKMEEIRSSIRDLSKFLEDSQKEPTFAEGYKKAGINSLQTMVELRDKGISSDAVGAYREAGIDSPQIMVELRDKGISSDAVGAYREAGVDELSDILFLKSWKITPGLVEGYKNLGIETSSDMAFLKSWKISPELFTEYQGAGIKTSSDMAFLKSWKISPEQVVEYRKAGIETPTGMATDKAMKRKN